MSWKETRRETIDGVELVVHESDSRGRHGADRYLIRAYIDGRFVTERDADWNVWLGHAYGQLLLPEVAERAKRIAQAEAVIPAQPTGVWLRDGNLIYQLEGTGKYSKGKELLTNSIEIRVGSNTANPDVVHLLVQRIHDLLKEATEETRTLPLHHVYERYEKQRAAVLDWLKFHFPIGAPVQFEDYRGRSGIGRVEDVRVDPLVVVYEPSTQHTYFLCPLTNKLHVLTQEGAHAESR